MKFFTKKAKIVLLVILLVGAVLLAYNSLNHELEYLDLKPHLGNSLITEGFTEKRKCRHKHHSKMDCPYYRHHHEELEEEMEELEEEEQSYANTNSYDRFNTAFNNYGNPLNSNHIMNSFDYGNGGLLSGKTKKSSNKNDKKDKKEMPKSQIPPGSEDLYILKSEIVPPVCPVCPSVTPCPNKPVPPCPACARCPEPSFECKKVPNYSNNHDDFLPMPVLNDFSTFGM